MPPSRPVALITGASSGIGADLARCAAADGFDLVLTARRVPALKAVADRCEQAHGVRVHIIPADLADPTAARVLCAQLRGLHLDIHTLVNNAGFGATGRFADLTLERQLGIIQVNITALTELSTACSPPCANAATAASSTSPAPPPSCWDPAWRSTTPAKAYVLSFTDALAEELRDSGVRVSALCPGPTATEFGDVSGMSQAKVMTQASLIQRSEDVALAGWQGLQRGRRIVVPSIRNKLLVQALRLLPRALVARVSAGLNAS